MKRHIAVSTALIGVVFAGAPAVAQDTSTQQPPATSQSSPSSPRVPDQTQSPAGTASVKVGDTVSDPAGSPVGTIETVEDGNAVLSTGTIKVRIPVSAISQGPKGATIPLTKAEVEAKAQPSAPPQPGMTPPQP